jgi:hypothetical protein
LISSVPATSIIIQTLTDVIIPVSCLEQGRWDYATPEFISRERIMPSRLRAMKAEQVQQSLAACHEPVTNL